MLQSKYEENFKRTTEWKMIENQLIEESNILSKLEETALENISVECAEIEKVHNEITNLNNKLNDIMHNNSDTERDIQALERELDVVRLNYANSRRNADELTTKTERVTIETQALLELDRSEYRRCFIDKANLLKIDLEDANNTESKITEEIAIVTSKVTKLCNCLTIKFNNIVGT
jgi:DNA gyrase/topoisomerase IV subunit A